LAKNADLCIENQVLISCRWEYYNFGNFTDIKRISQHFSDCRLHNDKYTKFLPQKNCIFRACIESLKQH